jgi:hypothetical protein
MKKLFTLLFLFSAFTSHAKRTMFGSNNNYEAPFTTIALVTTIPNLLVAFYA